MSPVDVMLAECQNCTAPTQERLCRTCKDRVTTDLRALAYSFTATGDRCQGLIGDLRDMVARKTVMGSPGRSGACSRLPFDPAASEMLWVVTQTLTAWAGSLAKANPHLTPDWSTPVGAAVWMARFPSLLAALPDAGDLYDEVTSLHDRVARFVDRAPGRVLMGRCEADTYDVECGTYLYGRADDDGQPDLSQHTVVCPTCQARYDTAATREWMTAHVRSVRATAWEISHLTGSWFGQAINVKTIRTWGNRGKIRPQGYNDDGAPQFLVGAVLDYAVQRQQERRPTQAMAS